MLFQKNRTYILAGATGTEIQRRGFPTVLPLWSAKVLFEQPELLEKIYIDYINAGADIIVTNTFRTQKRTLAKAGLETEWEKINKLAVQIGHDAIGKANPDRKIYLAASITTLEDCYRPDLVPPDEILQKEHQEQINLLEGLNVDFLLLETFNSIKEAYIASKIASESSVPFAVSFVLNKNARLMSGEGLNEAIGKLEPLKPQAFLVNCVQPEIINKALPIIKQATNLPFGAYGNGDGGPADDLGWQFTGEDKAKGYANYCRNWKTLGATLIGGCCGTNPEYTKEYAKIK